MKNWDKKMLFVKLIDRGSFRNLKLETELAPQHKGWKENLIN